MEFHFPSRWLAAAFLFVPTAFMGAEDPPLVQLSEVVITPASEGTPPSFSGMVTGAPPNGTARLQASVDLGVADTWTDIATAPLDNLGSATFTNITDSRPQPAAAKWNFFRVSTSAPPPHGQMVFIPGGTFQMGDSFSEGAAEERPVHSVDVSGFYLQNTEVTKAQWDAVRAWGLNNGYTDLPVGNGSYPSKDTNHPVHSINWYAILKWCNTRSQMEGLTPCYTISGEIYKTRASSAVECNWNVSGYRLPTEAEWEKAARGGLSGKRFPWGDTINHSNANYYNGSYSYESPQNLGYHPTYHDGTYPYTSPVGSFPANGYGLYDMAGNMWEWCWDWYSSSYYSTSPGIDPRGPSSGTHRILRGGSWFVVSGASGCRSAQRVSYYADNNYYDLGFRTARSSVP